MADKPIVRYEGEAHMFRGRALLTPIDHTNHVPGQGATNGELAETSMVIAHDPATGRIETKNTVYLPKEP